jgi:hypothetical protein
VAINKKRINIKDAQQLILTAIFNFKPNSKEEEFIRSCVVSTLTRVKDTTKKENKR